MGILRGFEGEGMAAGKAKEVAEEAEGKEVGTELMETGGMKEEVLRVGERREVRGGIGGGGGRCSGKG